MHIGCKLAETWMESKATENRTLLWLDEQLKLCGSPELA
jgi:hypothetical protein